MSEKRSPPHDDGPGTGADSGTHEARSASLERLVKGVARLLDTTHACVYLPSLDGDHIVKEVGLGLFASSPKLDPDAAEPIALEAWRSGDPLVRTCASSGATTAVPLTCGAAVVGVIVLAFGPASARRFEDAELELLHSLADFASLAIGDTRRHWAERAAREQAERLRSATAALTTSMDLREVLDAILRELRGVVRYDSASIQALRDGRMVIVAGQGFPNLEQLLGIGFPVEADNPNSAVFRTRAPVIVDDAPARYPAFGSIPHTKGGIRSFLGVPLLFRDTLIGMLALDKRQPGFYTAADGRLAADFAAQAAIAIENARLFSSAQNELAERKRAEGLEAQLRLALHQSAREWVLTFDAIDTPILILDLAGRIKRSNRAAVELSRTGAPRTLSGLTPTSLGPGEPWRKAAEMADVIGRTRATRHERVRDEASGKAWDVTGTLFGGPDTEDARILLIARDVTRAVHLEESRRHGESQAALAGLLAGLAHEIGNPIFGITATLDALDARLEVPAALSESFEAIREQARRLGTLMEKFQRYGSPVLGLVSRGLLEPVVRQAAGACARLAMNRGVSLEIDCAQGLPTLLMDPQSLGRALRNIVENALQHAPRGSVVLISVEAQLWAEHASLRCQVSDAGPGIPPEDLSRVFEPFFTRERGRTGLGLSVAQQIVEAHQGQISATNRAEGGTAVTVRLPVG